jgi:hypothetical protein
VTTGNYLSSKQKLLQEYSTGCNMGSIVVREFPILHLQEIQVAGFSESTCRKSKLQDLQNPLAGNPSCRIFRIHLQKIQVAGYSEFTCRKSAFQQLTTGKGKEVVNSLEHRRKCT